MFETFPRILQSYFVNAHSNLGQGNRIHSKKYSYLRTGTGANLPVHIEQ